MKIDTLVVIAVMMLPLIALVVIAVIRPKLKRSRKSTVLGIISGVVIVSFGIIWRLTHGGF